MLFVSSGCGTRLAVVGTDLAPSVGGELVVEELTDEQRSIELDVYGLPTPESRAEGATAYVVWLVSEDATRVELAGSLDYDRIQRAGVLDALTLMDRFALLVTAETTAAPQSPSQAIVLKVAYPPDVLIPERYRRTVIEEPAVEPPQPQPTPPPPPQATPPAPVEPATPTVEPSSPPATL